MSAWGSGRDYTEKMHAKNVLQLLESDDSYKRGCPEDYRSYFTGGLDSCISGGTRYRCFSFIGLRSGGKYRCPCHKLGRAEAIKCTWLALDKKGYLAKGYLELVGKP